MAPSAKLLSSSQCFIATKPPLIRSQSDSSLIKNTQTKTLDKPLTLHTSKTSSHNHSSSSSSSFRTHSQRTTTTTTTTAKENNNEPPTKKSLHITIEISNTPPHNDTPIGIEEVNLALASPQQQQDSVLAIIPIPTPPPLPDWEQIKRERKLKAASIPIPPPLPKFKINYNKNKNNNNNNPPPSSSSSSPSSSSSSVNNNNTPSPPPFVLPEKVTCNICFSDDLSHSEVFLFDCKHYFCIDCTREQLVVNIFSGNAQKLTCMSVGCKYPFPVHKLESIVGSEVYQKYQLFVSSPSSNPNCRWCPKAGCGNAVVRPEGSKGNKLICDKPGCGTAICFECRYEWHEGISCDDHKKRLKLDDNEAKTMKALKDEGCLPCPFCGIMTIKTDGCEYVLCTACQQGFCWLCLLPHDHNMAAHVHGPRYTGPNPWVTPRRRRARRVVKNVAFAAAAVVLFPPALALGVAAAAVGALPFLGYHAVRKIVKVHRLKAQQKHYSKQLSEWAIAEKNRRQALGLDVSDYILEMASEK